MTLEADSDLSRLDAPLVVKLAAAVSGVAGLFACLGGLQPATSLIFRELWLAAVVWSLVAAGAAQLVLGFMLVRNRAWVAVGATVLAPITLLLSLGWAVFALSNGAFSCLNVLAVPLGIGATILAPLSIGPARRATAARQRLADQGVDLGL